MIILFLGGTSSLICGLSLVTISSLSLSKLQLSSVIEERDQLRTAVDNLKLQKSVEPGSEAVTSTMIQVVLVPSPFVFHCMVAWASNDWIC